MTKRIYSMILMCILFICGLLASPCLAYNQPPGTNWGATNILDGIIPPPGVHLSSYTVAYSSEEFADLPGDNELNAIIYNPQLFWIAPSTLPGGFKYGIQAQLPFQGYNLDSNMLSTANSVLGDLNFGPFMGRTEKLGKKWLLHWFLEIDTFAPTGDYDKNAQINPSSNYWTVEPFFSLTLLMPRGFSFSTRQMYTYNFTNSDYIHPTTTEETDLQAGPMWHCNFSLMKSLNFLDPNLRLGAVGYYGKQLRDDDIEGYPDNNTKEEVLGIGPALHWKTKGSIIRLKTFFESHTENRPEGRRIVLRIINSF